MKMGNEQMYVARAVESGVWKYWMLTRGDEVVFLRGVPFSAEGLREKPQSADVFVGDRFGWDGHRLSVGANRLVEIVEVLIAGKIPASFVEEVQRKGTEYHAPCGGG